MATLEPIAVTMTEAARLLGLAVRRFMRWQKQRAFLSSNLVVALASSSMISKRGCGNRSGRAMTYLDYLNGFNRWLESGNLPGGSQLIYRASIYRIAICDFLYIERFLHCLNQQFSGFIVQHLNHLCSILHLL